MDGLRNPIGEEPPEVYWKRRLIVGVGLLVVIVLIWFVIAKATGGGDATPNTTTDPATTVSPAPDVSGSAESVSRACGPDDVTITTTANPTDVAEGALPVFDVSLAQNGSSACMIDTTAEDTELLITSGSDRIYSSTDCADDQTIAPTQLIMEPGSTENLSVTWDRQRSAAKCATVTAEPQPGTYNATVTIQGITSEPAVFRLE